MILKQFHYFYLIVILACFITSCKESGPRVLIFTKTKGYYHESIPAGVVAIQKLGSENGFGVDTTRDASIFTEENLKKYKAVIFLSTTGNVLNADQQLAFERYIQAGGGYMGIHAAADTEYEWPWYNRLVGGYFASHPHGPNVRSASIDVIDTTHQAMKGIPLRWDRTDEWYNYKSLYNGIQVLANLDEETYEGGEHGANHPIAWYHAYDGGRAFYTGGGHTAESFAEPLFTRHLLGGIQYAMGGADAKLDYTKAYAVKSPEENRFTKTVLSNDLNEPMELAVAADKRVFFVERGGNFYVYLPHENKTTLVHQFVVMPDTKEGFGNGLLGMTIDPDFEKNNFIYFFYTPNKMPARQYISRFVISKDNVLDMASEKVLIEIPIELEVSAHTGGSLAWDKHKNLFISVGDNTVPFASDGFAPIDEIPGRITYDAQRSSANTNDLRGKILRIHPEPDGTYTIPEGNLFTKGTPQTRAEIFVMGCRNPYRMSVDQETSIIYWGEIGPDSGKDGEQGPKGYDEINQARIAGNYGWPYFVGDSKPYYDYDFATKQVGALYDANKPLNNSVNNTGIKELPPTKAPIIWYPYDKSNEFPEVGSGGRSAIAGPVYHFDESLQSDTKFPAYYDNALFIYDWMRNWVFAVRLDENQNYKRMEPFMSNKGDFKRPIDLEIGPEGSFYMLEYGSIYGLDNTDARLVRIDYNGGNRKPISRFASSDTVGTAPMQVKFQNRSFDYDEEDQLTYEWNMDGKKITEQNPEYTFEKNGKYKISLKVTDAWGASNESVIHIRVGNALPQVAIEASFNSTFFFNQMPFPYTVNITDREDQRIDVTKTMVALKYIPKTDQQQLGHQQATTFNLGKSLMDASDCKACHQLNGKSVGPAFMEVATKYKNDKSALKRLANKIITGGGGVWGDHAMNAHPQLSMEQTTEIVTYILGLVHETKSSSLPLAGALNLKEHKAVDITGRYVLSATYTDGGGALEPLTNSAVLMLRPARVQVEEAEKFRNASLNWNRDRLENIHHKSFFLIKDVDLRNIKTIKALLAAADKDGRIEVHTDSPEGELVCTINYRATGGWNVYQEFFGEVKPTAEKHDLYFVYRKEEKPNRDLGAIDWVEFMK